MKSTDDLISPQLRHRVRLLGDLLGETMTEQYGEQFVDKIEEIKAFARSRRQDAFHDSNELLAVLQSIDDTNLIPVARAFNQFLNLVNIADQVEETSRESRGWEVNPDLKALHDNLKAAGIDQQRIVSTIEKLNCELVLTAHPTEVTRRTLIRKYDRIANQLEKVSHQILEADREELKRLIAEVWFTDEIRTVRPTPQDEAVWGYDIIEHSFWDAIPMLWRELDTLLVTQTGQHLPISSVPVKISSWMGGDRDGNPNVTTEVTAKVLSLARWKAADLYLGDINQLLSQLSMSQCSRKLQDLIQVETDEPYRILLRDLRDRLTKTRAWAEDAHPFTHDLIITKADLFDPLHTCYESLHECGMGIIAEGLLKETLIRLGCFGVTLVNLDVRQTSDKHEQLLDELTQYLELGGYASWSEKARQDFLLSELQSKRPLIPDDWNVSSEAKEVLDTFRLIANENAEGISSYIISMAKNPSDVLAVVLLLRKTGVEKRLQVVPLFETLDDLENASWTLERLLRIRWYKDYIQGHQQIMIGYADSAKDAGQMAAAWAQYRAQEELVSTAKKYQIRLTLFHGRGGTVGRGGGPARQAILSQPPGSVNGDLRVTEQGEMIRFKYGSPQLALINMRMIVSATIEATLLPPPHPMEEWRTLMNQIATTASEEYRRFVKHDENFVRYFDQGTPEQELEQLALGSRPARRGGTSLSSIDQLRAIPWVFAWAQKRMMLPAWLGTDHALDIDRQSREWQLLTEMVDKWPFFKSQVDMLEMVLAKTDLDISEYYDRALVDPELMPLGDKLRSKLASIVKSVNQLKHQQHLLQNYPAIKKSLALRNPYTDPLHFLQVELMSRSRKEEGEGTDQVNKALMVTIAGIAAGMRNTG